MKKTLIKKIISKDGVFDRELLVELMQPKKFRRYLYRWKFYRNFLELMLLKKDMVVLKKEINALEKIGDCFVPIPTNVFSKILKKLGVK